MPAFLDRSVSIVKQYERHLSAVAMVVGFLFDSWAFGPLDHRVTHMVFITYLLATGASIILLHFLESLPEEKRPNQRIRNFMALGTQFALGALLSGFCVFYLRSAHLLSSWPYLALLAAIFIGNEVFRAYHARLMLSALLFFFSLFSYAILLVPVLLADIGTIPFLLSGAAAVGVFALFLLLLDIAARDRLRSEWTRLLGGAAAIFLAINAFYFAGILPPLPLSLVDTGVYHSVRRTGDTYEVKGERMSWPQYIGFEPIVFHQAPGERVFLYSAVFVPARMSTTIVHRWERYDPDQGWVGQGDVAFTVQGGRDDGYRGYSIKSRPQAGKWRVYVTSADGRPLGRLKFTIAPVDKPVPLETARLH